MNHNIPASLLVPFPVALRSFIIAHRPEWGKQTLLDYVRGHYSAALRIGIDWDARHLTTTSCNKAEAKAAAEELAAQLKHYISDHVRVISGVPESRFSALIGPRGTIIHQMEIDTDTDIVLERQRSEVQIHDAEGDAKKLDEAQRVVLQTIHGDAWADHHNSEEAHSSAA